jgi:hypothetical protein
MRFLMILGVVLVIFGVVALAFQGVTFFTQERVVDAGPFKVDVSRPHTIIFNPIAGIVAMVAGLVLVMAGRRSSST